jgi:starch synthase
VVGSVAPELLPAIRTMNVERVTFVGVVSRTEVKKHLAMSHALVLPSIEEGLALVQGQALACGRPVIATPNTGSETLFTHEREGLIVKAQDSAALAAAFERLAVDPSLRRSMGAAALQRAQELGGWGSYADGMLQAAAEAKQLAIALAK